MVQKIQSIFTLANEFKEGDLLVGGTRDDQIRREAKKELSSIRIGEIDSAVLVTDGVSDAIRRSLDRNLCSEVATLTLGDMKRLLLERQGPEWARRYRNGLSSEVIAAAVKIMTNHELASVASALFNPLPGIAAPGSIRIGSPGHLGSRIQPNSPGDDEEEILISVLEGLSFGCGDVILGLNPASDDMDTIVRMEQLLQRIKEKLALPTRYSVLSDMVKQSAACRRTKVDVGFQSLAGTSRSLAGMICLDADGIMDLARGCDGLYFETGQGSEVTNAAAEDTDMVTLESRCYGLARAIGRRCGNPWMIVNDVAGFIGPEVFRTGPQLQRACLEDTVMAKLHGITMGLDICSTFHMGIHPSELMALTETIAHMACPAYLMAVAGKADPMLGILTTSFREHPRLRVKTSRQMTSAMRERLASLRVMEGPGEATGHPRTTATLYARYLKEGGDTRPWSALQSEGLKKISTMREKGFDIGYGACPDLTDPPPVTSRIEAIFDHARKALYAMIDPAVLRDCCPRHLSVTTRSEDREDYLAHPFTGEWIRNEDAERIRRLFHGQTLKASIQIVVSDGLNADAVNENLRNVLPALRGRLKESGLSVCEMVPVLKNGRVRAGYHAAEMIGPDILVHLIGERPGTGLNPLSAYLTYGKDDTGRFRWHPNLDHACTTAICGIHAKGRAPALAVEDMVGCIRYMLERHCSGVALGGNWSVASAVPKA